MQQIQNEWQAWGDLPPAYAPVQKETAQELKKRIKNQKHVDRLLIQQVSVQLV